MQKNLLKTILNTNQTVFSFKELILLLRTDDVASLRSKLSYHVKNGDLYHIRRGLYAKNKNYNKLELAIKILTPSYISFETVLVKAGVIFQYYSAVFVASYQSREIVCDGQTYVYRQIKSIILTNSQGVHDNIATPERAFLDILYLTQEYHFDNLNTLDWDKVYEIIPIYKNKSMKKRVDAYYDSYKKMYKELL